VVAESAEKEAIGASRHDGRGNGGGAGVGRDRKALGQSVLGAGAVHALDPVSPARVALLVAALPASVLRRSPRRTARHVARFAALARRTLRIGSSSSFFSGLIGLG
jgi:hypothetical protein